MATARLEDILESLPPVAGAKTARLDDIAGPVEAPKPLTVMEHVGEGVSEAWKNLNPLNMLEAGGNAILHPVDTAKGIVAAQGVPYERAKESFKSGDYISGVRHTLGWLLPLFGPPLDEYGNDAEEGHLGKGIGGAIGLGLQPRVPGAVAAVAKGTIKAGKAVGTAAKNPVLQDAAAAGIGGGLGHMLGGGEAGTLAGAWAGRGALRVGREVAGRRAAGPAPVETPAPPPVAPPPVAPPPVAAAPVAAKPAPKPAKAAAPPKPPAPAPIVEPAPPPEPPYVPTHDPMAGLDPKIAAAKQAFRSGKDKLQDAAAEVTAKQTAAAERLKPKPADPGLSARVQTLVEKAREIATPDEMAAAKGAAPLETVPAKFKGEPKPEPPNAELESLLQQSLDMVKAKKSGANAPKSGVEPIAGGTAPAGAAEPVPAAKAAPVSPTAVEAAKPAPAKPPHEYPLATEKVGGLKVRKDIPNLSSIDSSFTNAEELSGVREIPANLFTDVNKQYYSSSDHTRVSSLVEQIKASGEINPLIVAFDNEGAYILEGGHRMAALQKMGVKSIPAKVVIDRDLLPDEAPKVAAPLSDIDKLRARFAEVDAKPPKNPAHAEEAVNAPGLDIGPVKRTPATDKLKAAAKRAKAAPAEAAAKLTAAAEPNPLGVRPLGNEAAGVAELPKVGRFDDLKAAFPKAKQWGENRLYLGVGDSYADSSGIHLFGVKGGGNVADRAASKAVAVELRKSGVNRPIMFRSKSGAEEPI